MAQKEMFEIGLEAEELIEKPVLDRRTGTTLFGKFLSKSKGGLAGGYVRNETMRHSFCIQDLRNLLKNKIFNTWDTCFYEIFVTLERYLTTFLCDGALKSVLISIVLNTKSTRQLEKDQKRSYIVSN